MGAPPVGGHDTHGASEESAPPAPARRLDAAGHAGHAQRDGARGHAM
jgi:hypothetical protein